MKHRRLAASVVAGVAVTVLGGGVLLPAQAAVSVTAVGWWTASAVPPTVPNGGIAVGNDPSGATVAALRLDLGGGASSATLKLVETANQVDKLASMQVCGAADTWAPASGGAVAQAPADTCKAGSVALAQQADGSWTADLHQLLAGEKGSASVIVMPAPGAAAFQVAFDAPTVDGTTLDSSSSEATSDASSPAAATSSDTSTSPASSQGSTSVDTGSPSFSSAPSFSASPMPAVPAPAVATEPAAASAAPGAGATSSPAPASDASVSDSSRPFKANVGAGVASGHHATRGTAIGLFALALLIGAGAAAASWAKAQGFFEIASLRQRFIR